MSGLCPKNFSTLRLKLSKIYTNFCFHQIMPMPPFSHSALAARVSRYFHLTGPALLTCQKVSDACNGCKRVKGKRGEDKIRPLRNIGPADLTEGSSVLLDTAGPFLVHLQARQVQAAHTRNVTTGRKRVTVKRWILLAVDYYSHRLECSELEDMSTSSMIAAIQEVFCSNGWSTRHLCLDPDRPLPQGRGKPWRRSPTPKRRLHKWKRWRRAPGSAWWPGCGLRVFNYAPATPRRRGARPRWSPLCAPSKRCCMPPSSRAPQTSPSVVLAK